jgi:hypothetical protein
MEMVVTVRLQIYNDYSIEEEEPYLKRNQVFFKLTIKS